MAVTMKSVCTVKPSGETWKGVMPLSLLDQTGSITHEPTVYLYQRPFDEWLSRSDAVSDALKVSLSRALERFYPLAGRVEWSKEGGGRLQLLCNAMGAEFVEAEADFELKDPMPLHELRHLIPDCNQKYKSLSYEKVPLVLVQLTRFACGGISLGFAISHAVADGIGLGNFLADWARISRGETLETVPFFDRGVLRAGEPARVSIPAAEPEDCSLPTLITPNGSSGPYQFSVARLRLGKAEIEKVKKTANEEAGEESKKIASRPYSRYEAVSAHVWRCVTKARKHGCPEQPTGLIILMDSRSRLKPQLPPSYFGNAAFEVLAKSTSGELISRPLGYAASRIREAIVEQGTSEFIWKKIESLSSLPDLACMQNLEEYLSNTPNVTNPNLCAINWLTLPIYGLDFGWGKEYYVGPDDIEEECVFFMPCPSGDGSFILETCLQIEHMESFKELFYQDIED